MCRTSILALLCLTSSLRAQDADLAARLRTLEDDALNFAAARPTMLADDARARLRAANLRESEAWQKVQNRADWETFRRQRLESLRRSLGLPEMGTQNVEYHVGRKIDADGYRIECLVFRSWFGQWVTALLYLPAKKPDSMPGMLLCHSHHNPKTERELQEMGALWSKLGCAVLVMDLLGHGERREHLFLDAKSYPEKFQVGRQDYHFRYNLSLQLYAAASSLMGWMAADVSRGVDLLRDRGADMKKIVLLGAVAGGGDPAGVAAALDERIGCVVPFNFGGPQPETRHPLPPDAEKTFNYAGGGSWESTRNLHLSAKDGFMPWAIVGSVFPRRVIHAHEFAWDRDRDPVWKRYQKIAAFYKAADHLAVTHGSGSVTKSGPGNTHCNNIGAVHRKDIYPALKKWFDIPVPEQESKDRRPAVELQCLTPELKEKLSPQPSRVIAARVAGQRAKQLAERLAALSAEKQRELLRKEWTPLLGSIEPHGKPGVDGKGQKLGDIGFDVLLLKVEEGMELPALLFTPPKKEGAKLPVVVGVCQEGKAILLRKRSETVAELLKGGVAVCLVDVRGTGATGPGDDRGRRSSATSISATELMLGQPLLGSRLRDLRTVLGYLRQRPEIDGKKMLIWGDSFAPINGKDARLEVPLELKQPPHAEPLGGLLALFGTLFEEGVKGAYGRGGLVSYRSLLDSAFVHVPHDAIVPGGIVAGDLDLVAKTLGQRVRLDGLVDGLNRAAGREGEEAAARWMLRTLRE